MTQLLLIFEKPTDLQLTFLLLMMAVRWWQHWCTRTDRGNESKEQQQQVQSWISFLFRVREEEEKKLRITSFVVVFQQLRSRERDWSLPNSLTPSYTGPTRHTLTQRLRVARCRRLFLSLDSTTLRAPNVDPGFCLVYKRVYIWPDRDR